MKDDPQTIIDCSHCRLRNRRISIQRYANGDVLIQFRKLNGWKDIQTIFVRLSAEAAGALSVGLLQSNFRYEKRIQTK